MTLDHDTESPDVETAGTVYAERFRGPVGAWMLSIQERTVEELLRERFKAPIRVLELGGAHGQLTDFFLKAGHSVTVHASAPAALARIRRLVPRHPHGLHLVSSRLWNIPCADGAFDLVVGVRLFAHVVAWQGLLDEMTRVARRYILIDYPPVLSLNMLTPGLFWLKRRLEHDTRPYFCYRTSSLRAHLRSRGFELIATRRQFSIPMGLHRALANLRWSEGMERALNSIGVTQRTGSPALLLAENERVCSSQNTFVGRTA